MVALARKAKKAIERKAATSLAYHFLGERSSERKSMQGEKGLGAAGALTGWYRRQLAARAKSNIDAGKGTAEGRGCVWELLRGAAGLR